MADPPLAGPSMAMKWRKFAALMPVMWGTVVLLYHYGYTRHGIDHAGRPWGESMLWATGITAFAAAVIAVRLALQARRHERA